MVERTAMEPATVRVSSAASCWRRKQELDSKNSFRCDICNYATDRKNNLKRHVATMHANSFGKILECCGFVFDTKASLREHVKAVHRHGYACSICRRVFCRKALLKRHLSVHSGRKDFTCNVCSYATSHKSNLERHRKVHERRAAKYVPSSPCSWRAPGEDRFLCNQTKLIDDESLKLSPWNNANGQHVLFCNQFIAQTRFSDNQQVAGKSPPDGRSLALAARNASSYPTAYEWFLPYAVHLPVSHRPPWLAASSSQPALSTKREKSFCFESIGKNFD